VQVQSCGLNHLDLWLESGDLPVPVPLPRTPGGEVAGRIVEVGAQVENWRVGDEVAVQSNLFCGECEFCRRGDESLCLSGQLLGVQQDGGLAEQSSCRRARWCACRPEWILTPQPRSHWRGARPCTCSPIARRSIRRLGAGDGRGSGVGSSAIQIAKGLGARVITTGSSAAKRDLGLRLGAEFAVDSHDPAWPAKCGASRKNAA